MQTNTRKERFSIAYIHAVAARAGFEMFEPKVDIDSVDGVVRSAAGRRPQIDFQAKSTSRDVVKSDHVAFSIPKKNYDDLRAETVNPRILIVVILPDDEADWMSQSEEELTMRKCGYWVSLRGLGPSENSVAVTLRIPRGQLFDSQQLAKMMGRAQIGPVI